MSDGSLEKLSSQAMKTALASMTLDLRPVRRLASDSTLMMIAVTVFIVFSLVVGFAMGIAGFHQLSTYQRWVYYVTVLGCGALLALGLAPQIVPGAKRRISTTFAVSAPLLWAGICSRLIFPKADMAQFVSIGFPCLRAALLCAVASGILAFLLMRRGYLVTPLQTAVLAAVFAGFSGVAVLALHCPQQNWVHVVVWHLGAPVLSGVAAWIVWHVKSFRQQP